LNIKFHENGVELFHADRQTDRWTDMTQLIVALHDFVNMPIKVYKSLKLPWQCSISCCNTQLAY